MPKPIAVAVVVVEIVSPLLGANCWVLSDPAAHAGGRALVSRTPHFVGSEAVCTWLVPQTGRGKRFVGSIAVVFEGQKVTRTVSVDIG